MFKRSLKKGFTSEEHKKALIRKRTTQSGDSKIKEEKNGKVKRRNKRTVLLLCLTFTLQPV